jgi:hypothetical protein
MSGTWFTWIQVFDDSGEGPQGDFDDVQYSGTWNVSTFSGWSGGTTHKTSQPGATASMQVFGRQSVGIVMATGPDRGAAEILIDGEVVRTINTNTAERYHRVIVASVRTPDVSDTHTITVRNLATPGSARIDFDAFLVSQG